MKRFSVSALLITKDTGAGFQGKILKMHNPPKQNNAKINS